MRKALLPLALVLALPLPAPAGVDPSAAQAKAAVEAYRKACASADPEQRLAALVALDEVRHDLVVDAVAETALVDPEPKLRDVAAQLLGRMKGLEEAAGRRLGDVLLENTGDPEVMVTICRSIGKLGYRGAREKLKGVCRYFLDEEMNQVVIEAIRTFGDTEDVQALPTLLALAEYMPPTLRGKSGPRIKASSRAEARRIWWKKYGKDAFPKGTPETIVRTWMQQLEETVLKLTGQEFADAAAFRAWLTEHAKRLGIDRRELATKVKPIR